MTTDDAIESLKRYISHGIPEGGFLQAVIENNLMESFGQADETSRENLFAICSWVYGNAPMGCRGSQVRYREWIDLHRWLDGQLRDGHMLDELCDVEAETNEMQRTVAWCRRYAIKHEEVEKSNS